MGCGIFQQERNQNYCQCERSEAIPVMSMVELLLSWSDEIASIPPGSRNDTC